MMPSMFDFGHGSTSSFTVKPWVEELKVRQLDETVRPIQRHRSLIPRGAGPERRPPRVDRPAIA